MSSDDFAPQYPYNRPINGCFVVSNIIADSNKTIRIFNYPIVIGGTRDLLRIPGVSESSIRASLLKGELRNKLLAGEIRILCSDIDLLQFNDTQKDFLTGAGIISGISVSGGDESTIYKKDIDLLGDTDNINTVFTLPSPNTIFIYNSDKKIIIYLNGIRQALGSDYMVAESGGPGTGYNRVIFNIPPETEDTVAADYYIG